LCEELENRSTVKGRIVIFAGIALTAGVIVFHLHQAGFFSAKPVSTTPPQAAISEKIKIHFHPQAIVENQNSNAVATAAATQSPGSSVVDAGTQLQQRLALMGWLRNLAETNFDAALEYISKLSDGDERNAAVEAACYGLARKDPARAAAAAQELQAPGAVAENIVQQWAGGDMKSALAWVGNQSAGYDRDEMIHRIALVLAPSDPADAAGLVLEQIPEGPAQDEAVMTVLNQWAYKDFKSAIEWVETFPDTPFRERAVQELEGIHQYQLDLARQ
jgi:hypothetical protein